MIAHSACPACGITTGANVKVCFHKLRKRKRHSHFPSSTILTRPLHAGHVDGGASALAALRALQLLLQPLQLEDQRALLRAQRLQHGLLLDQRLRQLVQSTLQLRLAAAAQRLIGQLPGQSAERAQEEVMVRDGTWSVQ